MAHETTLYDLQSQKGRKTGLHVRVDSAAKARRRLKRAASVSHASPIIVSKPLALPHPSFWSLPDCRTARSPRFIEAMAREVIPVTGHVRLVPNGAAWTKFRAVGKTPREAMTVSRSVKTLTRDVAGDSSAQQKHEVVMDPAVLAESHKLAAAATGERHG